MTRPETEHQATIAPIVSKRAMICRGPVERQDSHAVLFRVANEHCGSDAHFGEIFTAPRFRLSFLGRVKLIENLVETPSTTPSGNSMNLASATKTHRPLVSWRLSSIISSGKTKCPQSMGTPLSGRFNLTTLRPVAGS